MEYSRRHGPSTCQLPVLKPIFRFIPPFVLVAASLTRYLDLGRCDSKYCLPTPALTPPRLLTAFRDKSDNEGDVVKKDCPYMYTKAKY